MTVPPLRQILDDIALCLVFFTRLPLPRFDFRGRTLAQAIWAAPLAGVAVAVIGSVVYALALGLWTVGRCRRRTRACRHDARYRLPARRRAVRYRGWFRRRQDARAEAGNHARQQHRRLWRVGAHHVRTDSLERDFRSRQSGLCLLRPCRRARRVPRAPACLHASFAARPHGRACRQCRHGFAGNGGRRPCHRPCRAAYPRPVRPASRRSFVLGLAFVAFRLLCQQQIGGQTGDTIGAMQQIGEVTVLLVASAIFY